MYDVTAALNSHVRRTSSADVEVGEIRISFSVQADIIIPRDGKNRRTARVTPPPPPAAIDPRRAESRVSRADQVQALSRGWDLTGESAVFEPPSPSSDYEPRR